MSEKNLYLALDTSVAASVAILRGDETIAERHTDSTREHAELTAPFVHEVLAEAGIDPSRATHELSAIFCGVGPGPFTGLRVGVITARALVDAWNVPGYGVMSLDAIAQHSTAALWELGVDEFIIATDARRREVYWAHYENIAGQYQRLHGPFVTEPAELPEMVVIGAGAGLYSEQLHSLTGFDELTPQAIDIARVGSLGLRRGRGLLPIEPQYLRGHDAKVPKQMVQPRAGNSQ